MSVVVVLPVKRFAQAKQRLGSGGLRPADRQALATGMLSDVLESIRSAQLVDDVVLVTGEPSAEVLGRSYGAQVIADEPQDGHNEAAIRGVRWALDEGAFHALLLPGDAPTLDPADIDALLSQLADGPEVVIVPDRHGTGTNALLLTPPDVIAPAFGDGSRERHTGLADAAGATVRIEQPSSLLLDVDTLEDLDALTEVLAGAPRGVAPHTRDALSRVRRA